MIKCKILGCGSSAGVPEIGCQCFVCKSTNPKNVRLRSSLLLEVDGKRILIDTSPDLRQQALRHELRYVDAIVYTHDHADHIGGIDEVKSFIGGPHPIPVFASPLVLQSLEKKFPYLFHSLSKWHTQKLQPSPFIGSFDIGRINIMPIKQTHGPFVSYGFRIRDFIYSTDVSQLDEEAFALMQGVKTWVIGCLRYHWAPTHCYFEKLLCWLARLRPEKVIITHMAHQIDYEELRKLLPSYVYPAYDGMELIIPSPW